MTASTIFEGSMANLVDTDNGTRWSSSNSFTTATITVDFGVSNEKLLVEYKFRNGTFGFSQLAPKEWHVQYSSDNIAWRTAANESQTGVWADSEIRTFVIPPLYVRWKTPHTTDSFQPKRVNGNSFIRRSGV
jgi:hypothetical protein